MNQKVPILLYHSISTYGSPNFRRWTVSPQVFENQLFYLFKNGYTPLTAGEFALMQQNPAVQRPKKPILITFDDGFEDFYTHALPILNQFKFASTLYVTSGTVGKTSNWLMKEGEGHRKMLSLDQLKVLPNFRVEIGAHTHSHLQLDLLSFDEAKFEIQSSKSILENHLQREVNSFAYPHGYFNRMVRQVVVDTGFITACSVKNAMSNWEDDTFSLSRIIIPNEMLLNEFINAVQGHGIANAPKRELFRTKLGRIKRHIETRLAA